MPSSLVNSNAAFNASSSFIAKTVARLFVAQFAWIGPIPVSYTHLDVYKRQLQDRGKFFIFPQEEVYAGQVVGENAKEGDIVVNVTKSKRCV